jgi:hypothetical protein
MDKARDRQQRTFPGESTHEVQEPAPPLACSVCLREIPVSAAVWRESSDYAAHFCGLECYEQWRQRHSRS